MLSGIPVLIPVLMGVGHTLPRGTSSSEFLSPWLRHLLHTKREALCLPRSLASVLCRVVSGGLPTLDDGELTRLGQLPRVHRGVLLLEPAHAHLGVDQSGG